MVCRSFRISGRNEAADINHNDTFAWLLENKSHAFKMEEIRFSGDFTNLKKKAVLFL